MTDDPITDARRTLRYFGNDVDRWEADDRVEAGAANDFRHYLGSLTYDLERIEEGGPDYSTASSIRDELAVLEDRLTALLRGGGLSIDRDPDNTDWHDVGRAVQVALTSLDMARQALTWVKTR